MIAIFFKFYLPFLFVLSRKIAFPFSYLKFDWFFCCYRFLYCCHRFLHCCVRFLHCCLRLTVLKVTNHSRGTFLCILLSFKLYNMLNRLCASCTITKSICAACCKNFVKLLMRLHGRLTKDCN